MISPASASLTGAGTRPRTEPCAVQVGCRAEQELLGAAAAEALDQHKDALHGATVTARYRSWYRGAIAPMLSGRGSCRAATPMVRRRTGPEEGRERCTGGPADRRGGEQPVFPDSTTSDTPATLPGHRHTHDPRFDHRRGHPSEQLANSTRRCGGAGRRRRPRTHHPEMRILAPDPSSTWPRMTVADHRCQACGAPPSLRRHVTCASGPSPR